MIGLSNTHIIKTYIFHIKFSIFNKNIRSILNVFNYYNLISGEVVVMPLVFLAGANEDEDDGELVVGMVVVGAPVDVTGLIVMNSTSLDARESSSDADAQLS